MEKSIARLLSEHTAVTRRWMLSQSAVGIAALGTQTIALANDGSQQVLREALEKLESWLTAQQDFRDVSRGNPTPHSIPDAKKKEVGMTRDTWTLDVVSDPDNPSVLGNPLSKENGNPFDFHQLMKLAEGSSIRFAKVMTCLNIGCPLGMGIWEGVALRDVVWLAEPEKDLRRVFYYGYHNDEPKQMFRSSLPIARVLEDPNGVPPVILCYKLNGEFLSSERGGPVRVVVPEAYGFKSIKWLTTMVLSNISHANDTYAEKNNDVDSPLKSFAATLSAPHEVKASKPFAVTGYAQSGISGLDKVQVWLHREGDPMPKDRKYFSDAPWTDAKILDAPNEEWGGGLESAELLTKTLGFDASGSPKRWPMRLGKAHWAYLSSGLRAGEYIFRCRTVDENGAAQPMPRPFRKSGHASIELKRITVLNA